MVLGVRSMMGVQMAKKVKIKVVFVPDSRDNCDHCCFSDSKVKCMADHGYTDCFTGGGGYWLIKKVYPCLS